MKAFIEQSPFRVAEIMDFGMFDEDAVDAESRLLETLESVPPGSLVPIDFTGVSIASAAARRLLKRSLLRITAGELSDRYIILKDVGKSRDNVQIMLTGESLVMLERTDGGIEFRGKPDVAVSETHAFLLQSETATASALKEELGLNNISTATNRLTNLVKLALARRIDQRTVSGGGREFVYAPVR